MSAEDLKQIVSTQTELMASLIKTATQLQNANNELALARAVVEAVRAVKAAQFGDMFWQCDASPLEELDDAFAAYDAAMKKDPP